MSRDGLVCELASSVYDHLADLSYVLRYLKAVQMIKKIIEENNLHVMATFARWIMAYPGGIKMVRSSCFLSPLYRDEHRSLAGLVEQGYPAGPGHRAGHPRL